MSPLPGAVHCATFPMRRGGSSILLRHTPEARQTAERHPHCHSVYLTFHLAGGNRTSVLLCVCKDNPRARPFSLSSSVRDGSRIHNRS